MPLTRHFYSSEEVFSSFLYTTSKGVAKESVFWCFELIQSGYATEAISLLFESWVWHYGAFSIGWFNRMWKRLGQQEVSSDDLLEEAYQLCQLSIRDHSVWNIFSRQLYNPSEGYDRVTFRSPPSFPSADTKEIYFIRAIYQHKTSAAWWIAQWISKNRFLYLLEWYCKHILEESARSDIKQFFESITNYELLLGYSHDGYDRVSHLLMLMSLCLTSKQREKSCRSIVLSSPVSEWSIEWSQLLGRKAARIYSIPYYGLYGTWGRGRMIQTKDTMNQLFDMEKGVLSCPFWDEALTGKGYEEWEEYFPDDLPDEWTRSEKEKSHGSGILRVNEKVSLWGYTKRYMMGRSYLAWNHGEWNQPKRIEFFEEKEIDGLDSPFQTLLLLILSQEIPSSPSEELLSPKHKRLVLKK